MPDGPGVHPAFSVLLSAVGSVPSCSDDYSAPMSFRIFSRAFLSSGFNRF